MFSCVLARGILDKMRFVGVSSLASSVDAPFRKERSKPTFENLNPPGHRETLMQSISYVDQSPVSLSVDSDRLGMSNSAYGTVR